LPKEETMADYVATAETEIDAPRDKVWAALTDPEQIKEYMFGSQVVTDWKRGSPIVWKGEYEGKAYEDKGEIVEIEPERRLKVTHFSPLSGQEDRPESYHTLLYELEGAGERHTWRSARTTTPARRQPSIPRRTGKRCLPA
jgi:uncharacterized protein YndB with AHSA1/START domain